MTHSIGRNRNTNSEAIVATGIALNGSASTTLLAANPDRIGVIISSGDSNRGLWVKFQAAATDNIKKGIFVHKSNAGAQPFVMLADNPYTGEISAIADSGSPTVYVTEW